MVGVQSCFIMLVDSSELSRFLAGTLSCLLKGEKQNRGPLACPVVGLHSSFFWLRCSDMCDIVGGGLSTSSDLTPFIAY